MGLFDLFKSKEEKEKNAFVRQQTELLFPMGMEDILTDCDRVGELINWKIQGDELKRFMVGCKTLVLISESYDDDGFANSFVHRSKSRITFEQARDVYVYLAGESFYRTNLSRLLQSRGETHSKEFAEEMRRVRKIWESGSVDDVILGAYGEYGLVATNPIPIICVNSSYRYLSRLRFEGALIEHERAGSTSADVTVGAIDIYKINQNGRDLGFIYICPYHRKDSKKAPKGFTLGASD